MGRPLGSRNRPKGDAGNGGAEVLRNTVSGKELRGYVERIEDLNSQQKDIAVARAGVLAELKAFGYDAPTVRAIIKRRAMDPDKRATMDALMDEYIAALGNFAATPLGEAGADRMRQEAED
ncbi:MAG: DUF2312 domain-containing protein [Methylocella sp.]